MWEIGCHCYDPWLKLGKQQKGQGRAAQENKNGGTWICLLDSLTRATRMLTGNLGPTGQSAWVKQLSETK
jgi:hypothetical protein